ncbi:MAG: hypothetical protein ACPL7I_10790, partial [Myxococcota bacterium]
TLLIFYLSSVIFHRRVNEFIDIFYKKYSFESTNRFFIFSLIIPLIVIIILFFYKALRSDKRSLIITLSLVITPLLLFYYILFVSNVEAVHYFQYAIIAVMIFKISDNLLYSFVASTILGVVDEAYQYYVLYAGVKGLYLDYNDMLFNVHGAIIGLVFYLIVTENIFNSRVRSGIVARLGDSL